MWIIIQKIPLTTTQRELNQFLNRQINGNSWFGLSFNSKIKLKSFSILRMTDRASGVIECHGLAELETSKPEEDALKSLNGHQLHGRTIAVRKYYHRAGKQIQKSIRCDTLTLPDQHERRRPYLHIEMLKANNHRMSTGLL